MAFKFRLQRVLDYRASLVEAQEVELGRCQLAVAQAEAHLSALRRQRRALISGLPAGNGRIRVEPVEGAWRYLDLLHTQEEEAERELRRRQQALAAARERLAELKKQEQIIAKLRDRQRARADLEARRQETRVLDDITNTRYSLRH